MEQKRGFSNGIIVYLVILVIGAVAAVAGGISAGNNYPSVENYFNLMPMTAQVTQCSDTMTGSTDSDKPAYNTTVSFQYMQQDYEVSNVASNRHVNAGDMVNIYIDTNNPSNVSSERTMPAEFIESVLIACIGAAAVIVSGLLVVFSSLRRRLKESGYTPRS